MHIEWDAVTWYSKLITALVFIANGMLWFYVGMQYQATMTMIQAIELAQTPIAHTTAHQTILKNSSSAVQIVDISNWKTYTNKQYGFEVKYPIDSSIEASTSYGGFSLQHYLEDYDSTLLHFHFFPGKTPSDLFQFNTTFTNPEGTPGIINEERITTSHMDNQLASLFAEMGNDFGARHDLTEQTFTAPDSFQDDSVENKVIGGISSRWIDEYAAHVESSVILTPTKGGTFVILEWRDDQTWHCMAINYSCTEPNMIAKSFPDNILSTFKLTSP